MILSNKRNPLKLSNLDADLNSSTLWSYLLSSSKDRYEVNIRSFKNEESQGCFVSLPAPLPIKISSLALQITPQLIALPSIRVEKLSIHIGSLEKLTQLFLEDVPCKAGILKVASKYLEVKEDQKPSFAKALISAILKLEARVFKWQTLENF